MILAVDIGEPADRVREYLAKHKLSFRALLDSDSRVSSLYGVRGTPTRFLIRRDGKIIAGSVGPRDWASREARALIGHLLSPPRKPRPG